MVSVSISAQTSCLESYLFGTWKNIRCFREMGNLKSMLNVMEDSTLFAVNVWTFNEDKTCVVKNKTLGNTVYVKYHLNESNCNIQFYKKKRREKDLPWKIIYLSDKHLILNGENSKGAKQYLLFIK